MLAFGDVLQHHWLVDLSFTSLTEVSLARSLRSFLFSTTSSKAMWACEPGLSQQICLASEEEIRRWKHWWKSVLPDYLSLLTTWSKTDFHFSRRSCTFPSQVAEHHQRWLEMDCIHGVISSQPFCLALLVSFLTTHLERCQTSYWWLMCGKSFFMLRPVLIIRRCLFTNMHVCGMWWCVCWVK